MSTHVCPESLRYARLSSSKILFHDCIFSDDQVAIEHVISLWSYKIKDNWDYFVPKLRAYRRIMRRKLRKVNGGIIPDRYANCFASIDAKRFEIDRPSGPDNQQAIAYNDYYGFHNLGYQSVVIPDGLIMHFSGPFAGCGNDLNFLSDSDLLRDLRSALHQANMDDVEMDMVADKLYRIVAPGIACLRTYPTPNQEIEDDAASKIRVPNEWTFGKIGLHFPFVNISYRVKLNERDVGNYINVSAILTNIHTCLYGSNCATHFSEFGHPVYPPQLEEYMAI